MSPVAPPFDSPEAHLEPAKLQLQVNSLLLSPSLFISDKQEEEFEKQVIVK